MHDVDDEGQHQHRQGVGPKPLRFRSSNEEKRHHLHGPVALHSEPVWFPVEHSVTQLVSLMA